MFVSELSGPIPQNAQILVLNIFHQQIIAYLPYNATEIVKFLKTCEVRVCFEKWKWIFFRKKNLNFFKIVEGGNLLSNAYQLILFLKNVSSTLIVKFFVKTPENF